MVNSFCQLLINGDKFAPDARHSIDKWTKKALVPQYVFEVEHYPNLKDDEVEYLLYNVEFNGKPIYF